MVNNMGIYQPSNIIGTVIKNPEILKSVLDHLKIKKCVSMQLKHYLLY